MSVFIGLYRKTCPKCLFQKCESKLKYLQSCVRLCKTWSPRSFRLMFLFFLQMLVKGDVLAVKDWKCNCSLMLEIMQMKSETSKY